MNIRAWRWPVLLGCVAVALLLTIPQQASARRRGGSSLFVNTPYGLIPKSQIYAGNMSPAALQRQVQAEQKAMKKMQSAYNKKMGITSSTSNSKGKNNKKN